jgi:hypothetical protein
MQVVLGLLPADAVFIVRRGYVVDTGSETSCPLCEDGECNCSGGRDEDNGVRVDPLLWAPKSSGYVSEFNPWQAGIYTPPKADYKPRGEDPDAHSYVVPVNEYLSGARIQDDTTLAVLVDEVIRQRARADTAEVNYRFMIERAADEKLDGYRELGQRAANAERERDDVQHFARVLVTLGTHGRLCAESAPTPWTVERRDNFFGSNTDHVWQLWDANESCIEYLSASVDGPAFVAWVNSMSTLAITEVTRCD